MSSLSKTEQKRFLAMIAYKTHIHTYIYLYIHIISKDIMIIDTVCVYIYIIVIISNKKVMKYLVE